jgi:hypothetical protein
MSGGSCPIRLLWSLSLLELPRPISTPPAMLEARAVVAASELTGLCCPVIAITHGNVCGLSYNMLYMCSPVPHNGLYEFTFKSR